MTAAAGAWTDERIAVLRAEWGRASAREIAQQLGVTRCAVIGKAHRLGFAEKRPIAPVVVPGLRHLADLGARDCRFPIGNPGEPGFGFCGREVAAPSAPYCRHHAALCYLSHTRLRVVVEGEAA